MTSLPLLKLLTSFLLLSGSKTRPPAWPRSPPHTPAPAALPPAHLPPVPLAMRQLMSEKKHLLCAKNSSKQQSCSCEQDRQMFYPNGVQWGGVRGGGQKKFFLSKQNKQGKTVLQAIKKSTAGQGVRGSLYAKGFISQFSGSGGGSLQKSMQEEMNSRYLQVNTVSRKKR